MVASSDFSLHMERIAKKVNQGKAALFIGAGVSQMAGAPSTPDLVSLIKKTFDKVQFDTNDFIDVCQSVIDSDYYDGRKELETLIRRELLKIKPSKMHLELPKYSWSALFTTNFDDLIEETFRTSTDTTKRDYYTVLTDDFSITDRSTLLIFKLMGTLHARQNDPGRMVLSRLDFINSLRIRAKCIETLSDIIRDGTVVFVGYSGRDQLAFEIMGGIAEKYGRDSLTKSYMLLDNLSCVEGKRLKFSRNNIIPIECSFEAFMDFLSKKPTKKILAPVAHYEINVAGFNLGFSPIEVRPCQDFFHVMNEKDLDEPPGKKDDFFRGINQSWGAYEAGWDFQRDIYVSETGVHQRIKNELSRIHPSENRVLVIRGMPGIGKTMMLRRIAYDSYKEGAPVLIFDPTKSKFDFRLLDSFLMKLDRELLKTSQGKIKNAKSVIILDDILSTLVDPTDVSSYLSSRGRSSLIVACLRMGDEEELFSSPHSDVITIPQLLSKVEVRRLAEHLRNLEYLPSSEIWEEVIVKELEGSFFAAMYSLVDPSKRPLGKIIYEQFVELSEEQKKLFLFICAFHRFNLPINLELLARVAYSNNYTKLMKALDSRKIKEIVRKTVDLKENILFTTHNQIIAKKTVDFFMPDRIRQKELYLVIIDKTHFSLEKERELVEKMFIRNMGPNRNVSGFLLEDQLELFSMICKKKPTKSLLHHLGLLQSQAKNFAEAEKTLVKAKNFREIYFDAYRGESTRNILTSMGCMYVDWAEENIAAGKGSPDVLYKKAEKCLLDAMRFRYPMPHPYHALARMYMRIGDQCTEDEKKFENYAKALDVLDSGKKNVYSPKAKILYEAETLLYTRLRDEKAIEKVISVLERKYRSARGYYLFAKTLLIKSQNMRGRAKKTVLFKAYAKLNMGLRKFPADEPCLRLKAELFKMLYPLKDRKSMKEYFEILERWFQVTRWHSSDLLFDLGVTAFKLGYFKTAFKRFSRLDKISQGHPERFSIRDYMRRNGERINYYGTIMRIKNPYEGEIRVDSIPRLDHRIPFSVELLDFPAQEGDPISFFIGFNLVSPKAVELRRRK